MDKALKQISCEIELTLACIGGKQKPIILWFLSVNDTQRFSTFQKYIPKISNKVLTTQLRELEEDGLISRTVYPEVPPKVEYQLTERGKTLNPLLDIMCQWGRENANISYELTAPICSLKAKD